MALKSGDVVRLKSGGPRMTVKWVGEKIDGVQASWFDGTDAREQNFTEEQLELAPNDDGGAVAGGGSGRRR